MTTFPEINNDFDYSESPLTRLQRSHDNASKETEDIIYLKSSWEYYNTKYKRYHNDAQVRRMLSIALNRWISQETLRGYHKDWLIKEYEDLCYHPRGKEGYYNLFNPRSLISPSHTPLLDEWIDILLSSIAGYNDKNKDWLHRAIFYKWANPEDVRVPAVIFYWVGGSGKSTFIEFLKSIFWKENVTGNLRQSELAGNFDMIQWDKLIYEFAEITSYNANTDRQMVTKLKNIVFAPTLTVNPKWRPQYQADNFGWYFVTSNSMRPLVFDSADSGNRRFVAMKSSRPLTSEESEKIYKAIENPEAVANYLAWLHQEYDDVLNYKEIYPLENEDKKLLVQNSESEIDEFITLLRMKYSGQRLWVSKFDEELKAFAFMNDYEPSSLKRLFKAQKPFFKSKWMTHGENVNYYDIK